LWCAGDRCGMSGRDEDSGRSRRSGAEYRGWSSTGRVVGGRIIERSGDVVCGLHHTRGDEERMFLCLASKPKSTVCQWFDIKMIGLVSPGLASKSVASGFPVWTSKSTATA
jgi:hypothetical protein